MTASGAFRAAGLALSAHLMAGTAMAQAETPPADAASGDEEIVVTATKRGQKAQEIPVAITALSGVELSRRGVTNVEQLSLHVPNLNFGVHDGATFITIRGVGSTINSGVTEPTVATYVDGVFLPRATMASLSQVDLDRVEVLRGPQGTLYGRNATGGAINFIAPAPSDEFEGEINVSAGSREQYGASGFISGPLADTVFFRLSAGHDEHQSYLKVLPGGETTDVRSSFVRGALRFEPSEDLSVDLVLKYDRTEGADTYQQLLSLSTSPLLPPGTLQTTLPNRTTADAPFDLRLDTFIASATINWALSDDISARSITGYINHHATTDFDADGTSFAFFTADNFVRPSNSFSQEFDVFGKTGSLQWLVGAYYFRENFFISLPVAFPTGLNTGDPASSLPPGTVAQQSSREETESYAIFTDLTWSLSDRLRIVGGLRYNTERKNFSWTGGATIPGAGFFGLSDQRSKSSSNKVLPKIAIQYDLTDDANIYVQYQQGFKSGGHNLSLDTLYGPENIDAYEAGLKTQWMDRRVTANVAFFYYDYSGLQITNNVGPTTTAVENADAEIYGVEAELRWQVAENFDVNLAANWLHARYTDFVSFDAARPGLGFFSLDGVKVVHSPDYTINAGAQWRIPLNAGFLADVVLRGDLFHSDDVVLRYFATANDIQEAYTVVNLSATLNDAEETTSLRLFVNNVGDETYLRQIDYLSAIGVFDGNYSEPRTFGVQLSRRF